MDKPQITILDPKGWNNSKAQDVLLKGNSYKDLSTICIIVTRGMIPAKVVQAWWGLMAPMNQKFMRMFVEGMEVGEGYSAAIENILAHPELSRWKYAVTLEEDNMPPPDGLLKLYEGMKTYDAVGALYWTKGFEHSKPMCYGRVTEPLNFVPFLPEPESITPCFGLGMGFTLFKLEMFKDQRLPRPFFKTLQRYDEGKGAQAYTQDLLFFSDAGKLGYKFACDARVRTGHYDVSSDMIF